eukprot:1486731-Amphidinium_carterae.2
MAADRATAHATPVQVSLLGGESLQVPHHWHTMPWNRANPVLGPRLKPRQAPKDLRKLRDSTGQQKSLKPIPLCSKGVKVSSAP